MRIMVTGSEGFIGSHLCADLADSGHDVRHVDIKREPLLEDCRDPGYVDAMLRFHEPDVVVHLAAKVGRLFGEDDVAETVTDNAGMTATVAKLCGERGVRLVYASTSEVYGDCGLIEAYEGMLPRMPHNIYGLSKRWGEEACKLYAPEGLVLLRLSMPYGPGLPWGRGRAALINFIHAAIVGDPITVHRGSERSWCWIGDTVRAIRYIIEQQETGPFNVGRDDNSRRMVEVARMVCDVIGADPSLIVEVDAPSRQTVVKRLATEKIRRLGWEPEVDLHEGIRLVHEWIVERMRGEAVAA